MSIGKIGPVAFLLTAALCCTAPRALAQSNCKQVKGDQEGIFDPGTNTTSGPVRNAGWLNGTYVTTFHPGAASTQDPATVTFLGDYTVTTTLGQLKVFNIYMLTPPLGIGTVLGRIDPAASTGIFAGATGRLYFSAKVTNSNPFTVQEGLTGEVCFAQ